MASAEFEQAAQTVKQLTTDPGNEAKLRLYGLYKQATEGDVSGSRPGFTNPVGRQKYDAWATFEGTSREAAQEQYVALVRDLTSS
ncbi:acyl-CoA-binding protein [Terrabacter lapilli]|uniref:Acyl-CoA-binding protein n=1 Tax=Terrabacter lapilli TaxID=436231 RepID=A0ABP5DZD4_9MICO|nr:acyl-CoA-binding protein [Terrabacter sp.]